MPNPTSEVVKMFYQQVWNLQNQLAIVETCHPDIIFRGSLGCINVGHDGVWHYVSQLTGALDHYYCEILDLVVAENKVFAKMLFSGKHVGILLNCPATGKMVNWMGAGLFTIHQGLIKEIWILGDIHGLIEQMQS